MRAIAVLQPGRVEIVDLPPPVPGPYQAIARTDLAALCNATHGKLVAGHFPGVDRYPLILGHESTGLVEAVGPRVKNFRLGQRVIGGLRFDFGSPHYASGWGAFSDYTVVNDHDAMRADGVADAEHGWLECYEIQRAVDPDIAAAEAVLLCTWREVLAGFGDFHLCGGERILIFGAGPVGLSFTKFARLRGASWIGVVDPLQIKQQRAAGFGASDVFSPDDPRLEGLARSLDAVIDAVGRPSIVNAALPLVRLGGSICVYGVIEASELRIAKSTGPYNFNLFVHQWPTRWRERESQAPLCKWIRAGKLSASEFVTHEFAIGEIDAALAAVKAGDVVKCLLRF